MVRGKWQHSASHKVALHMNLAAITVMMWVRVCFLCESLARRCSLGDDCSPSQHRNDPSDQSPQTGARGFIHEPGTPS